MSDPTAGRSDPKDQPPRRFSWSTAPQDGSSVWDTRGQTAIEDPFLQRPPAPPPRPSRWLAIVAVASTLSFFGAAGIALWLFFSPPSIQLAAPAAPSTEPSADVPLTAAPLRPVAPSPSASPLVPSQVNGAVPRTTKLARVGKITVVDIGSEGRKTLEEELGEQRAAAQAERQTLMVMTTRFGIQGFNDVDAALRDPLLQKALDSVRLVRVDVVLFESELEEMGVPTEGIPWFVLIGPDLVPRDGIDGGEWDDDIPRNIAPVLGAFVQGHYKTRRQTWKPPRGKGIAL